MNDLREKNGNDSSGVEPTGGASRTHYKKLEAFLMLLYQAYLQKETVLEPEIKAALWRRVQLQGDFPIKIRMLQLELLSYETDDFNGEWNQVKDSLFPVRDDEVLDSLSEERSTQIQEYKKEVFELLGRLT